MPPRIRPSEALAGGSINAVNGLSQSLAWAIALAVAIPLLSVALTETALRLHRRGLPLAHSVVLARDLLLPAIGCLAILLYVVGWTDESLPVRIVKTAMWLFVTHTALSFLSAVMFGSAREGTWQAKMPRLFIDMARGLIVMISLGVILSAVWGQNLGQLAAALGVGSLVLGLALQEPVGNLFSGIMVMMERPVGIDDWIEVGGDTGTVVESNWRSVHLRTSTQDLVVVPHTVLAKTSFINFSRPNRIHIVSVKIHFSAEDAPNRVSAMLLESAGRTPGVLSDPPPKVRLADFQESCNEYEVLLPVSDFGQSKDIAAEYRTLVWYTSHRDRLTMPYAAQRQSVPREPSSVEVVHEGLSRDALKAFPHMGLAGASLPQAISSGTVRNYAKGERIVEEGRRLFGVHLIIRGTLRLSARNAAGLDVDIALLERGEFFGEKSLFSNAPSEVTITAVEDVELLVLGSDSVHALIEQTPNLARQIEVVMEARREAIRRARS
jgi:hypothetical protein